MIDQAQLARDASPIASGVNSRVPALKAAAVFTIPLVLLAGVIALFLGTGGAGLNVSPAAPIENIQVGRIELEPGIIRIPFRNVGPRTIAIAQVAINDAFWGFAVDPSPSVGRLGAATVTLAYPWVTGEAYEVKLITANSIVFAAEIGVAAETAVATTATLISLTLVGLYVGVVPILLGMCWLPALGRLSLAGTTFLLAGTAGLLVYLGIDAASEALETAGRLGPPFQGTGLVGVGILGTFLLLAAISAYQRTRQSGEAETRWGLALTIAIGIGLHNLGEGLAIGAAYAIGAAALGSFLVIGFIIQNITEGLGIVVPIARQAPSLARLAGLGLIGGAPAILGAWIGGLSDSVALSVLFLAIGAGAVFQVAVELARIVVAARHFPPMVAFAGAMAGMLVLYVTGIMVK